MKFSKLFSIFVAAMAITFALTSCDKNEVVASDVATNGKTVLMKADDVGEQTLTPEMFDFFGQAHNYALDYVFENAVMYCKNTHQVLDFRLIEQTTIDFFNNVCPFTSGFDSENPYYDKNKVAIALLSEHLLPNGSYNGDGISEIEKTFLSKLEAIIYSPDDLKTKLRQISELNDEINWRYNGGEFEDYRAAFLYMVNSVASHSLSYWAGEKGKKWADAFGVVLVSDIDLNIPIENAYEVKWSHVWDTDIQGAIGGLVHLVRSAAISAAGSSAVNIIYQATTGRGYETTADSDGNFDVFGDYSHFLYNIKFDFDWLNE